MGEAAALGSAFLWALTNILLGSQAGRVPTLVISALRGLYGMLFLVAVAAVLMVAGRTSYPTVPRVLALAGSGALGIGIGDTLYIGSLHRVGVSRAFPISMAVFPLLTVGLAVTLLGEDVTPLMVIGTLLTIGGVCLIVSGGSAPAAEAQPAARGREMAVGVGLVVVASVLWALASVWLRSASEGVEPVLAQAIRMPAAGVVTAAVALAAGHQLWPRRYGARSLAALLLAGVVGTGIGSLLFLVAVQHAGVAPTAVLSSSAPLFALPMATVLLGERITPRVVAGTALSIAGIWLVVLKRL
jgi:drug/metabolite transporter (DMT)-like permease